MRAWAVPVGASGANDLRRVELPERAPGPGQVMVRVRAVSINYRDLLVAAGRYFGPPLSRDLVPMSDGAGEVVAIGDGVSRFCVGDRVATVFFQRPLDGPADSPPLALGSPLDGVLRECVTLHEDGLVGIPHELSYEEAACFPCAGVTAWHALFCAGKPIKSGDTVLILGTGGVSIFALLFARAAGARVIATSSTDDKLNRVTRLGASDAINYRRTPDWDKEVTRITGGRGVDCVVEVGGITTMPRSFNALARGGKVGVVGVLGGHAGSANPMALAGKGGSLHGVFVGSREMFLEMNRAIDVSRIKPVTDRVFPFEQALDAFKAHAAGEFFGKVVITI